MRRSILVVIPLIVLAIAGFAVFALLAGEHGGVRNPFNLADVPDPDGEDVQAFAKGAAARFPAKVESDDNAAAWANITMAKRPESIDGAWASRWKGADGKWTVGSAIVHSVKDRVFILYIEPADYYLMEARRVGDTFVGRFININIASDTSPFVARVVDNARIDGVWLQGRWDMQRKVGP